MNFRKNILLLLFLTACSQNPTKPDYDYKPEVNIFGLLTLNNHVEHIIVEQTFASNSEIPYMRGIEDADVRITSPWQAIQLTHTHNGRYMDTRQELDLRIGVEYLLSVQLSDGRQFIGRTIMPDAPKIEKPLHNDNVQAYQPLDAEWRPSLLADDYIVSISNIGGDFTTTVLSDTTTTSIFPFLFAPPNVYIVKVAAASPEYFSYVKTPPEKKSQGNIQGAIGVFGALAYNYITIEAE